MLAGQWNTSFAGLIFFKLGTCWTKENYLRNLAGRVNQTSFHRYQSHMQQFQWLSDRWMKRGWSVVEAMKRGASSAASGERAPFEHAARVRTKLTSTRSHLSTLETWWCFVVPRLIVAVDALCFSPLVTEASGSQQESSEDYPKSWPYPPCWQTCEVEVHLCTCPGFSY